MYRGEQWDSNYQSVARANLFRRTTVTSLRGQGEVWKKKTTLRVYARKLKRRKDGARV